jgi:hypothetical protein
MPVLLCCALLTKAEEEVARHSVVQNVIQTWITPNIRKTKTANGSGITHSKGWTEEEI